MRVLADRYRLDHQIGVGGMATVWRAYDQVLQRPVAVKVLIDPRQADQDRLRQEAVWAARIAHPNVAAVHDFGACGLSERGDAYLVMELLDGPLLSEYLRGGPVDWPFAARIAAEVSAGLAAAHGQGIVHRDIKPGNIVLTRAGAKILDFGIAARDGEPDRAIPDTVLGTIAYLAPERFEPTSVKPAMDMFAVGAVFHQCLTGRLPWDLISDTPPFRSEPAPLPAIDDLPAALAELGDQCLHPDPAHRPTSIAAALLFAAHADVQVYVPPVPLPLAHAASPAATTIREPPDYSQTTESHTVLPAQRTPPRPG